MIFLKKERKKERKINKQISITGINYLIPNAIWKLLISGTILVNLYLSIYSAVKIL